MKAIVTEKHRAVYAQMLKATDEVPCGLPYEQRIRETWEAQIAVLARAYPPDPQPTTERPTVPGNYWMKLPDDEWKLAVLTRDVEADGTYLFVETLGDYLGIVQDIDPDCEWLRIDPPASKAKSMAEVEFSEIAAAWHGEDQPASRDEKGEAR